MSPFFGSNFARRGAAIAAAAALVFVADQGVTTHEAEACGVKAVARVAKPKKQPKAKKKTTVLVVGNDADLVERLERSGHKVKVVRSADDAKPTSGTVIVAGKGQSDSVRNSFPNARVVTKSTRDSWTVQAVNRVASDDRSPTVVARAQPRSKVVRNLNSKEGLIRAGTGGSDGRQPVAAGGSAEGKVVSSGATDGPKASGAGEARAEGKAKRSGSEKKRVAAAEPRKKSAPAKKKAEPAKAPVEESAAAEEPAEEPKRVAVATEPKETVDEASPAEKVRKAARSGHFVKKVTFGAGSTKLNPSQRKYLSKSAKWLKSNPDVRVRIEGHASQTGPSDVNQTLSEERADMVVEFLVGLGVERDRFEVESFGETRPAYSAEWKNRRVELKPID